MLRISILPSGLIRKSFTARLLLRMKGPCSRTQRSLAQFLINKSESQTLDHVHIWWQTGACGVKPVPHISRNVIATGCPENMEMLYRHFIIATVQVKGCVFWMV